MQSMADVYADALHDHFKILYGNWPPGMPLELGDYGIMNGNVFQRSGNIADRFGISLRPRPSSKTEDLDFKSANSTSVTFNAKGTGSIGGGANVKASLDITFTSEDAVFFYAGNCSFKSIEDKVSLGESIFKLWDDQRWDIHFTVVTDIIEAGATTVILSGGSNSSISLEASADSVQTINLADASIGLTIKSETNVGFKVLAKSGLQPLIGLMKLQRDFPYLGSPKLAPYSLLSQKYMRDAMAATEKAAKESFYFGKLH